MPLGVSPPSYSCSPLVPDPDTAAPDNSSIDAKLPSESADHGDGDGDGDGDGGE
eukprot:CAMPEP_0197448282 /NCGR_PEP_ID=MMETSP1175-20131217/16844_1 /TAXON_ID=1003142 /ORGANISM="Triceratium dubium, Strain CCMP147" /LENGTH=53 /DNA_ID=CAMNT_0042979977 /DNA_START=22 /DNA_END=180 /DNA_ORIENTATION=-